MQLTELDKQLQQIAVNDWEKFVKMIGEDAVIFAKICYLRQIGNTYGQITQKLSVTRNKVLYECKQCEG